MILHEPIKGNPKYKEWVEIASIYKKFEDIPYDTLVSSGIKFWIFNLLKKNFENPIAVVVTCQHCGEIFKIIVEEEDYKSYKSGEKNINVFDYLSDSDRELLISQTCNDCWNRIMKCE